MQNVLILANDFGETTRKWQRVYEAVCQEHNLPGAYVLRCDNPTQLSKALHTVNDDPNKHLIAVVTDNAMSSSPSAALARWVDPRFGDGMSIVRDIRKGTYGRKVRDVPIAVVSKGTLPVDFDQEPPPAILRRLDERSLLQLLQHQVVTGAMNAEQMRTQHLNMLIEALDAFHTKPQENGIGRSFLSWLHLRSPQKIKISEINQRDVYEQWLESAPPLTADGFAHEKIEFMQEAFANAFPPGFKRYPSKKDMERLSAAYTHFQEDQLYIANDELNNQLHAVLGEIHSVLDTYKKSTHRTSWFSGIMRGGMGPSA